MKLSSRVKFVDGNQCFVLFLCPQCFSGIRLVDCSHMLSISSSLRGVGVFLTYTHIKIKHIIAVLLDAVDVGKTLQDVMQCETVILPCLGHIVRLDP